MQHADCIIIGLGGVGSAAAYHLAVRGVRVLGLDQFPIAHDRGSSHGSTRVIRQAYFEHPDYVPLLSRAYELWTALETQSAQRLFDPVGALQMGPANGVVIPGVIASATQHQLTIEKFSHADLRNKFPQFHPDDNMIGVLESNAGFLHVEACVQAHATLATQHGAQLRTDEIVREWSAANGAVRVVTDRTTYTAARLVIAAGAWSSQLLRDLHIPLVVKRKPLFWFSTHDTSYAAAHGAPCFLFETRDGIFYGTPQIDARGVKLAEHTGGEIVTNPLHVDRTLHAAEAIRIAAACAHYLPRAVAQHSDHSVCMYTMSPDENFIIDHHPDHATVTFAAGLSGHGFKFTSVLGEILADLSTHEKSPLPIEFLSVQRLKKN